MLTSDYEGESAVPGAECVKARKGSTQGVERLRMVFDSKGKGRIEERVHSTSALADVRTGTGKPIRVSVGREEGVWLEEILNLPARAGLISWRV